MASQEWTGTYIGAQYPELRYKTALLRFTLADDAVQAQFDDAELISETPEATIHWGFGWHNLPRADFRAVKLLGK